MKQVRGILTVNGFIQDHTVNILTYILQRQNMSTCHQSSSSCFSGGTGSEPDVHVCDVRSFNLQYEDVNKPEKAVRNIYIFSKYNVNDYYHTH